MIAHSGILTMTSQKSASGKLEIEDAARTVSGS
jgi:hypothetical protein